MTYKYYEQMNKIAEQIEKETKDPEELKQKLKELEREMRSITD